MAELIEVVGYSEKFNLDSVKNTVVKIADKYYFKHDDLRVVQVKNREGKYRFYRTDSPLITRDPETFKPYLKSECYKTEDGVYLPKNSPYVVELDGKYYRSCYVTKVEGVNYLITDDRLSKWDGRYYLKTSMITLSSKYYQEGQRYVPKDIKTVEDHKGHLIRRSDSITVLTDPLEFKKIVLHRKEYDNIARRDGEFCNILYDFQDKTNPQEDRLEFIQMNSLEVRQARDKNTLVMIKIIDAEYEVPCTRLEYFQDKIENFILPRYLSKIDKVKEKIVRNYSDTHLPEQENKATVFKIVNKPYPGKHPIFKSSNFGQYVTSKTFVKTGGLKYSFGVELETSQGLADFKLLNPLGIDVVGDRSVGAGEYVTSPMQGDNGLLVLQDICKILNESTLVDDRCGLHVHIGTLSPESEDSKESVSFSKEFIKNSINLGALIEEELFRCMPKNRSPILYHCHSIKRFAPVTKTNFNANVGAYMFGPKEWWLEPNENCPVKMFDFEEYKLGSSRNHNTSVGNWADARYKWLNLIPSYTKRNSHTIEFRIFSGTTVYTKVYAYLLFSMAFTYVADNKPELIKTGVTITDLLKAAFGKSQIAKFAIEFFETRKNLFNRNVYEGLNFDFLTTKI